MKMFALYTAARAGLFLACWAAIWLVIGWFTEWDSLNALSTAMVALIVSSVIAFMRLRGLRARFAADVEARAQRATAAFNARRSAEDADDTSHLSVDDDQADMPQTTAGQPWAEPQPSGGGADRETGEQP